MDKVKAVIGLSKCSKTGRLYGIRFEPRQVGWEMTWAFPISERAAAGEKYDRTQINGPFLTGETYPGCPDCGSRYFWYCHCGGRMNCYDGNLKNRTCQWCGWTGDLGGSVEQIEISSNI